MSNASYGQLHATIQTNPRHGREAQTKSSAGELEGVRQQFGIPMHYTDSQDFGVVNSNRDRIPKRAMEQVIEDFGMSQGYRYPQSEYTRRYAPSPRDARFLTTDTSSMALGRSWDGQQSGSFGAIDEFKMPQMAAKRVSRTIALREFREKRDEDIAEAVDNTISEMQRVEQAAQDDYNAAHGELAARPLPLGANSDEAAKLIQAAYRGHRVRAPDSGLLWRELTAYRIYLANEKKREIGLENVMEAHARLENCANLELTLGTNRRMKQYVARAQKQKLLEASLLSSAERSLVTKQLHPSGAAHGAPVTTLDLGDGQPASCIDPGAAYGVDYELHWRQILSEEQGFLRENLREQRQQEMDSRDAAAAAQCHAAELSKARTDAQEERTAAAAKAQFRAHHRKDFLEHFSHVLEARLVDHGEKWSKACPHLRPH